MISGVNSRAAVSPLLILGEVVALAGNNDRRPAGPLGPAANARVKYPKSETKSLFPMKFLSCSGCRGFKSTVVLSCNSHGTKSKPGALKCLKFGHEKTSMATRACAPD